MAKGRKTGGRTKGTPNKVTGAMAHALAELDPGGAVWARQIYTLACEPHGDPHVRIKALTLGAPYLWGRPPEHIQHSGEIRLPTTVIHKHVG